MNELEPRISQANDVLAHQRPHHLRQRRDAADGPQCEPEDQKEEGERRPTACEEVGRPGWKMPRESARNRAEERSQHRDREHLSHDPADKPRR